MIVLLYLAFNPYVVASLQSASGVKFNTPDLSRIDFHMSIQNDNEDPLNSKYVYKKSSFKELQNWKFGIICYLTQINEDLTDTQMTITRNMLVMKQY